MIKLNELLSSIRFWQITVGAIAQVLVALGIVSSEAGVAVANIVTVWLGAVATVGTVDKVADKISKKK